MRIIGLLISNLLSVDYVILINMNMPDKSDYLQFALENILNQISEVKALVSNSTKETTDFRTEILQKLQALELRVNTLEVEKRVGLSILGSGVAQKLLLALLAIGLTFLASHAGFLTMLASFLK